MMIDTTLKIELRFEAVDTRRHTRPSKRSTRHCFSTFRSFDQIISPRRCSLVCCFVAAPVWIFGTMLTLQPSPRMLAHYAAYLFCMVPLGSMTFFAPTIVNGLGYDSLKANLMTVPPWIFGYCVCLFLAWSADTHNARGWHVAASSTIGFIGWLVQAVLPPGYYNVRYGMLFLCASGAFPSANPLSGWVTSNIPSITTMFLAVAIHNSGKQTNGQKGT